MSNDQNVPPQGPQVIVFELDGRQVEARAGETIWQVAKRQGTGLWHQHTEVRILPPQFLGSKK